MKSNTLLAATFVAGMACSGGPAHAQAPTVTAVSPLPNAVGVAPRAAVSATLSQPVAAGAGAALRVFGSQRGGLRSAATGGGTASVAGNTVTFTPGVAYAPGEPVQATLTRAAQSAAGTPLAQPWVWEFRAAAAGTGRGTFVAGPGAQPPQLPYGVALGDLDGDGDLDMVVSAANGQAGIRFNDGRGNFSGSNYTLVGGIPLALKLADVDGDGDLDLLSGNNGSSGVSVRLNNGLGVFSGTQEVPVGQSLTSLDVGDIDGDGDLDLVTGTYYATAGSNYYVKVRLNDGQGNFGGTGQVFVTNNPAFVNLSDVDRDGDLDLVVTSRTQYNTYVFNNNGSGTFGFGALLPAAGVNLGSQAVGDVTGDGFPDILVTSDNTSRVYIYANNGMGAFPAVTSSVPVGTMPTSMQLADLDADGDLDLLVANFQSDSVSVRLNNGTGQFRPGRRLTQLANPETLAVGDIDSDGDVDVAIVSGCNLCYTVFTQRNGGQGPVISAAATPAAAPALALLPNPAHGVVLVRGPAPGTPVQLLDALGRVRRTVPATAGAATFDVGGLAPGVYVVRAAGQVARLVVE